MPRPTERYTYERGTKLSVKLLGETAEVGVDGADALSLPALGKDATTFTTGRQTLYVKPGWSRGRSGLWRRKAASLIDGARTITAREWRRRHPLK